MKNKILFYSSVKYKELFEIQRFYHIDIELLRNLGYEVYLSNHISDFLYFWRYNLSFIYFYKYGLFPAIISRLFGKRVYFTGGIDDLELGVSGYKKYKIQKFFFKLCYFFSTKCILVSKTDENNVMKIFKGKLPKRTCLSFHTIDIEKFHLDDLLKKENIFSTIAWMENIENVYRKGIDKSLEVFKELTEMDEYAHSKFYVIGKQGSGSDYLKSICKKLKIEDKVIFTGSINEESKIEILKRSKYYFQLSTYEGFGIAALEALAAKNIVIHSGNGGLKDIIKDYGIKVDIENRIHNQVDSIHSGIRNFDYSKFSDSTQYINNNFSYIKRQIDLERIFNT